jgi:hypothetical protein
MTQTDSVNARLLRGEIVQVGHGLYRRCPVCGSVVRINKPILGDLHFCAKADD